MTEINGWVRRNYGSYNWANPSEKQHMLMATITKDGETVQVSDTFDELYDADWKPWERSAQIEWAVDEIAKRQAQYLYSSGRDEIVRKVGILREWLDAYGPEINIAAITPELARATELAKRLQHELLNNQDVIEQRGANQIVAEAAR